MRIKGIDSGIAKVVMSGGATSKASSSACEGNWERSATGARMWAQNVAAGGGATETQPSSAAADAFAAALAAVPERLQHILTQLEKMISRYQITTLDLQACNFNGQDDGIFLEIPRLVGVLAKCSSMSRLAM